MQELPLLFSLYLLGVELPNLGVYFSLSRLLLGLRGKDEHEEWPASVSVFPSNAHVVWCF